MTDTPTVNPQSVTPIGEVVVTASKTPWVRDEGTSILTGNMYSKLYGVKSGDQTVDMDKDGLLGLGSKGPLVNHEVNAQNIPRGTNETLKTGAGDDSIYINNVQAGASLTVDAGNGYNQVIARSTGGDITMKGGKDNDEFAPYAAANAPTGKDAPHFTVDGGAGENVVDLPGAASQYSIKPDAVAGHYDVTQTRDGKVAATYDVTNANLRSPDASAANTKKIVDSQATAHPDIGSQNASQGVNPASLDYSKGAVNLTDALKPKIDNSPEFRMGQAMEKCYTDPQITQQRFEACKADVTQSMAPSVTPSAPPQQQPSQAPAPAR
jgi:hypothetical protein